MNNLLNELINQDSKFYDLTEVKYKEYLWHLRMINIERLWGSRGFNDLKNIKVAVLDSGIDLNHLCLSEIEKKGYNFVDQNEDISDEFGHGTKINGILAAGGPKAEICGIASQVNIYNLKVINKKGKGNIRNIIEALSWCLEHEMDIINLSIGHQPKEEISEQVQRLLEKEKDLIQRIIDSGAIVIAAIGNSPQMPIQVPACYEGVIPVGSYGVRNTQPVEFFLSEKNNQHNHLTIFAPGEYVLTTEMNNQCGYDSGSSIAAAHVTGVVAYLKAMMPNLNAKEMHDILLKSSSEVVIQDQLLKFLNVGRAIECLYSLIGKTCHDEK